jgi:hypothetical protein
MKERVVINAMYYCVRGDSVGQILVMNTGGYVLGHYGEYTTEMVWQRVIPASDRKSIEDWLSRHFPVHATSTQSMKRATTSPA